MVKQERTLQLLLAGCLSILVALNIIPAMHTWEVRQQIRSDVLGGSSLAERYLIYGDWPSSGDVTPPLIEHTRFIIIKEH